MFSHGSQNITDHDIMFLIIHRTTVFTYLLPKNHVRDYSFLCYICRSHTLVMISTVQSVRVDLTQTIYNEYQDSAEHQRGWMLNIPSPSCDLDLNQFCLLCPVYCMCFHSLRNTSRWIHQLPFSSV